MQPTKPRILVVDDEPGIRDIFQETLDGWGYVCDTASSGEEALEALATQGAVDLIFLDILMPGMNGVAVFQHVRELYPHVAVVFVTAVDDVNTAVGYLKDGAYDYLVKPASLQRLRQAVEETLSKRKANLADRERRRLLEEQEQQLSQRMRELKALNHLFRKHLSERFANAQDDTGPLQGPQRLS